MNIALKKPAYQLHPYIVNDATFDASNAVDGLKSDLSAWGGQCVITADGYRTSIWWVNLNSIHSIHHITIYYRTDNVDYGMIHLRYMSFKMITNDCILLQFKELFSYVHASMLRTHMQNFACNLNCV